MLKPIKNDYIYQDPTGVQVYDMVGAGNGKGAALFTYTRFLGYGSTWDQWYGSNRGQAIAVTLTADAFTAGDQVDLVARRERTRTLASDGDNRYLYLFEATGSGLGGVGAGYQILTADGTGVTQGSAAEVTENYVYDAAPTAVLQGTQTFFVHRAGDASASPSIYTTPRASIDKVTLSEGVATYTTIANGLAGYLDLRGVVPVDATTAFSVAGPLNMNGDTTDGQTYLRFYRLGTDGSVSFTDVTFDIPMAGAAPYPGTTDAQPAEILSWAPPTGAPGPSYALSSELRRWGIRHDGSSFALEQMPLQQIDPATQPPDASEGTFTTGLVPYQCVPVGDQLFVVRGASDTSYPGPANDTYLRITQYDGTSGEVVDDVWTLAPAPELGWWQSTQGGVAAFYDASLNQLVVAAAETSSQITSPYGAQWRIRMATFEVIATNYPISERLRSSNAAFL